MLNEPSALSEPSEIAVPSTPANDLRSQLRSAVDGVFLVDVEDDALPEPITASYIGALMLDSLEAYDKLDEAFKPLDHVPVFLEQNGHQVVRAVRGRFKPRPRPVWPNALLLGLTILSVLFVGSQMTPSADGNINLLDGWPFALGLMLILGTHEMGHYVMARRHKVAVTLPYFIPMPLVIFGTFGAFIQLREPMRNRRVLLDIGAAGPLAGMIIAIPVLLIGLKTSPLGPTPTYPMGVFLSHSLIAGQEGNSILYALAKFVVFGRFLPNGRSDVFINQFVFAGWAGLLVTSLNLIPVGQLDGGHVLYSLLGERARLVYIPALVIVGILSVFYEGWCMWLFLLLMLGRLYATPLDNITPLDPRRRWIAILSLLVFVLVFMPIPWQDIPFMGLIR